MLLNKTIKLYQTLTTKLLWYRKFLMLNLLNITDSTKCIYLSNLWDYFILILIKMFNQLLPKRLIPFQDI